VPPVAARACCSAARACKSREMACTAAAEQPCRACVHLRAWMCVRLRLTRDGKGRPICVHLDAA
jgi:hypothetical protein